MTTFVLLHGAFHGGWCWARVAALLRAAGHVVYTPTQTGLGDRAHLMARGITLDTFVEDLVSVLETEELTDAVLVGHSFGGNAISGAAERVPERIRQLVYFDAVVPNDGVAPIDHYPADLAAERRRAGEVAGSVPPPPPSVFGVPDGLDADWVRRRLTPHPFGTMASSLRFRGAVGNGLPATYVFCSDPVYEPLAWAWARVRAREQAGWAWRELAAGHDAMVTAPGATADLLMEIAP